MDHRAISLSSVLSPPQPTHPHLLLLSRPAFLPVPLLFIQQQQVVVAGWDEGQQHVGHADCFHVALPHWQTVQRLLLGKPVAMVITEIFEWSKWNQLVDIKLDENLYKYERIWIKSFWVLSTVQVFAKQENWAEDQIKTYTPLY